jgi:Uma2 family endonuclease
LVEITALLILLGQFVRKHRLGRVYAAEAGFVLSRDPDTVRAPDLAVEVTSPGNTPAALDAKIREYLAAGARAVWVIDPPGRTLTVHRPDHVPVTLSEADTVDGGSAVPGFHLPVREIFEP